MPPAPVNMFGGSPLNRLGWLRPSHAFLNAILEAPSTRWILFYNGQPLMPSARSQFIQPLYLTTAEVRPILGPSPYFGQAKEAGVSVVEDPDVKHSPTESARHLGLRVVFLGLHEAGGLHSNALPSSEFLDPEAAIKQLNGTPYFTADVLELGRSAEELQDFVNTISAGRDGLKLGWTEPRSLMTAFDPFTAGIFASARSMVDWNTRNQFCPGCGSPSYSMWGGWKIACSSLLPWAEKSQRKPCFTGKGLHNFTHPRTDSVVIMIAIDDAADKILLGRGKKYPGKFYSALAGFIEPGESFEDAVVREMWEEAGVTVWDVTYHSGQPWPFPANLMVGFYARGDSTKPVRLDLDNELEDAQWYTRAEIKAVLNHAIGTKFRPQDYKRMNDSIDGQLNTGEKNPALTPEAQALTPSDEVRKAQAGVPTHDDEPPFRLPPVAAIAGVLIRDWVDGKLELPAPLQKGNL